MCADAFAAAAEECEGVAFKLHGRDPQFGLDCLGLVLHALARSGHILPMIRPYRLRNTDYSSVRLIAGQLGWNICDGKVQRGDLIWTTPGPAQLHFAIASGAETFVHAHAGLGKVVVSHGVLPWPTRYNFRLSQQD